MNIEALLSIVSLVVLATICTLGVLWRGFDDTLAQRVALAGVACGACAVANWIWQAKTCPLPVLLVAASAALLALETARITLIKAIVRAQ